MDRRLSNVQQHMRSESETRRSQDSGQSVKFVIDHQVGNGVVWQQPRSKSNGDTTDNNDRRFSSRTITGFSNDYYLGQNEQKRRRPSLWEALAGLVCSLGAWASRAAKMAARRGDML